MKVSLPDGSTRDVPTGSTFLDLAKSIGPGLAKAAVVAKLDDEIVDLQAEIPRDGRVTFLKADAPESEDVIRHSAEHVLATAVLRLFPGAQVTMGPSDHSKDFYYDFDVGRAFTPEDLEKIEAEMTKVIAEDVKFTRKLMSKSEAADLFKKHGQRFKPEILEWIKDADVSIYENADFVDLCRGPHVPNAGKIGAFKLLGAAGSYWRGDATKDKLQRIRGVAFSDKKKLAKHFETIELAKARDHRKLGKELELFGFSTMAPASPFFFPKGATVYNLLIDYVRGQYRRHGYQEVVTPQIYSAELWKTSGHYENFSDNMYFAEPGRRDHRVAQQAAGDEHHHTEMAVKPMNCPGHCVLYGMQLKSFRDLPWRVADFGRLHRSEGEAVHGMMRVRTFSQDDAHIFCAVDQMYGEMKAFLALVEDVYRDFGLSSPKIRLATRPEKRMGSDEVWDKAEGDLASVLKEAGREYTVAPGEGAFYGPKWEFHVEDALGRSWQLGTLQVDFSMPKQFGLEYVGHDGARHTPVMLHRAVLGSLERFYAVYLEHTGGAFPPWLAPIQARVLPVTDRAQPHAEKIAELLAERGLRAEVDRKNEKLGFKMREAQMQKIPYVLVVGDKEVEQNAASVRLHGGQDLGAKPIDEVLSMIADQARMPGRRQP